MASKPSERFVWAAWACCVACDGEISSLRGYETGTFWDGRGLADTRDGPATQSEACPVHRGGVGGLCCVRWRDFESARVRDGYILGRTGTRGHARRSRDTV